MIYNESDLRRIEGDLVGFGVWAETLLMLSVFENELDALLEKLEGSQSNPFGEDLMRRYQMVSEMYDELDATHSRVALKMRMVSDRVVGGLSAGNILESSREPD